MFCVAIRLCLSTRHRPLRPAQQTTAGGICREHQRGTNPWRPHRGRPRRLILWRLASAAILTHDRPLPVATRPTPPRHTLRSRTVPAPPWHRPPRRLRPTLLLPPPPWPQRPPLLRSRRISKSRQGLRCMGRTICRWGTPRPVRHPLLHHHAYMPLPHSLASLERASGCFWAGTTRSKLPRHAWLRSCTAQFSPLTVVAAQLVRGMVSILCIVWALTSEEVACAVMGAARCCCPGRHVMNLQAGRQYFL